MLLESEVKKAVVAKTKKLNKIESSDPMHV